MKARGSSAGALELRCPSCGRAQPPPERFCPDCGLPLVAGEGDILVPVDERHARARRIKPQLAEGPLVRAAGARNQAEAELIQELLLDAGVPSLLRRSAGFDVPDFLAAGPRDVLVPQSAAATAAELLEETGHRAAQPSGPVVAPGRLLGGLLLALALGALLIWVITLIAR